MMEYKILTSSTPYNLSRVINEYIQMGWKPQGGLAVDEVHRFCQAMVRKNDI